MASDLKTQTMRLKEQIYGIPFSFHESERGAAHFGVALVDPANLPNMPPNPHHSGALEQTENYFRYSYAFWVETPRVIDIIKELNEHPAQDEWPRKQPGCG